MTETTEERITSSELVQRIRSVLRALREHHSPNAEIHDVIAELSNVERQLVNGLLPMVPLRSVLGVIAQFEYTPWRLATVVEDLHKIWSLLAML
ncbi:MAG TPA: hypothetical protein VLI93_15025 [Acetobacteraceae bacterium]|nr:hypothetical protein [Acetobacteraceae bacterium]